MEAKQSTDRASGEAPVEETTKEISSHPRESRKRLRADIQDMSLEDDSKHHDDMTTSHNPLVLRRMRLEAIFHPKFENEGPKQKKSLNNKNDDQQIDPTSETTEDDFDPSDIRSSMKHRVHQGKGYLEVSLKHSGSLLLWSGGQRYYSKNSTHNLYTHVGEILLRQHFARAWWSEGSKDDTTAPATSLEQAYQECSDYVEKHRLTLAFEVVTSLLGHHGALPHRDFLILTAIADRQQESFYTTEQLLEFCQRYRLPHNDFWAFFEDASVQCLFHLYDTTRETGMAPDTEKALNQAADAHVASLYPHVAFQGNLLEGIVIRYVENGGGVSSDSMKEQHLKSWSLLSTRAEEILVKVPPTAPPSFVLAKQPGVVESQFPAVLTTDIRTLSSRTEDSCKILLDSDVGRRRVVERNSDIDVLQLVRRLLPLESNSLDDETRRIAQLLLTLDSLKALVNYSVATETSVGATTSRWLCTIHIRFDTTHKKFRSRRVKGGMELFRGFTIELDCGHQDGNVLGVNGIASHVDERKFQKDTADKDSLMLKMKFLPYMIRTFGCRNGLSVIATKGPAAFSQFTMILMRRWGISDPSVAKWQPFFDSWGLYAKSCLDGETTENTNDELPPLTQADYLYHFDHFAKLYESGRISGTVAPSTISTSTFRGLVVVLSLTKENADFAADSVASSLGGLRRCQNIKAITMYELAMSCAVTGGGLVCSASVDEGVKAVRRHVKTHANSIFVLLFGCDEASIASVFVEATATERKVRSGEVNSWRKTRCKAVVELADSLSRINNAGEAGSAKLAPSDEFNAALKQLADLSENVPVVDTRPGLLVFFPSIPGSGKSSLSNDEAKTELEAIMKDKSDSEGSSRGRKIAILIGDEMKKKYWSQVGEERGKVPSSVVIADKNAPPTAWEAVGTACSKSSGVAVPVLPDDVALATTSVSGVQMPEASIEEGRVHVYPFSLRYLAVCIARVLSRPPGSHAGQLDCSTENVCMVVVKFFAFYRRHCAEDFVESIWSGVSTQTSSKPIRVPFFANRELPNLPPELEQILIRALQVQYGNDITERDGNQVGADTMRDMEMELRKVVGDHSSMLLAMTADEDTSRRAFVSQIVEKVSELPTSTPITVPPTTALSSVPYPIVLASVDVNVEDVHEILRSNQSSAIAFLEKVLLPEDADGTAGRYSGDGFVTDTHVTMAHMSEATQSVLRESFGNLIGDAVDVTVSGLMYNHRVAALQVEVAGHVSNDPNKAVPACNNKFSHVTLWHDKDTHAVESNTLPALVESGSAFLVEFEKSATLRGHISFWGRDRSDPIGSSSAKEHQK